MDIGKELEKAYKDGYKQGKKDAVRHGKWIFNSERYSWECSECKCQTGSIFEESKSKFCKNCGAKMIDGMDGD